ncbi:hypothetical protein F383_36885 [Gossypium arboreum]|uniref:Uncharacterized protein n=1 Tax=Gossypium arboreum TaxID=29729 RepID=A0A0B0MFR4_GOSAR|nr:hypothetical protein F383_38216 [Gossypium arboreum]KHG09292.1 hypothetical protein F383_36885 [Gossypium arboreum]
MNIILSSLLERRNKRDENQKR